MMPLVYFVRHGQTAWNAEARLQGQSDVDINEVGKQQAAANGRFLATLIPDASAFDFVASPMRRTRQTMEIVRTEMGLDPKAYRTDDRLRELSFGDWQGYTMAELEVGDPGANARRMKDKWGFVPPGEGAESYRMLTQRIAPWLAEVRTDMVCVTHGGVIRAIFRIAGGLDDEEASTMDTPQDTILRFENGRLEWLKPTSRNTA
ncbi:histidine phosphatase family protein [Oryzicola mucosus]|uniref:Histidine phosphatase family protein n=1 Tax=Oryzicola mucosus TaxID=2767425 RepID=A0A8J6PPK8_9HYPH|nr:histidine phosphatase family protein [Oryzicola mucosus]